MCILLYKHGNLTAVKDSIGNGISSKIEKQAISLASLRSMKIKRPGIGFDFHFDAYVERIASLIIQASHDTGNPVILSHKIRNLLTLAAPRIPFEALRIANEVHAVWYSDHQPQVGDYPSKHFPRPQSNS